MIAMTPTTSRRTAAAVILLTALAAAPALAQGGAPTIDQAKAATYTGVDGKSVTLVDGRFEGPPLAPGSPARLRVELVDAGLTLGDLDGDGRLEAVVLLASSSGGSGNFLHAAVLKAADTGVRNVGTALVGDRVQVRALAVAGSSLVIDTVEAGPSDPLCCPTAKVRRVWTLKKDGLAEGKAEPQGTVSFGDLEGRSWTLWSLDGAHPLPPNVTVKADFNRGRVSGTAGCNRYTAPVTTAASGQSFAVGPANVTRMMCPEEQMAVERAYLKALGVATMFSFLPGDRVALAYRDGDAVKTLVFVGK